ncbi:MAG: hypothetical protein WAK90_23505, partial [Pseudolabrys sp.]
VSRRQKRGSMTRARVNSLREEAMADFKAQWLSAYLLISPFPFGLRLLLLLLHIKNCLSGSNPLIEANPAQFVGDDLKRFSLSMLDCIVCACRFACCNFFLDHLLRFRRVKYDHRRLHSAASFSTRADPMRWADISKR